MSYVPIAAVLVRQAVEQVGKDERPARRQAEIVRERALPEWAETRSASRALARSTRPAGTRPNLTKGPKPPRFQGTGGGDV